MLIIVKRIGVAAVVVTTVVMALGQMQRQTAVLSVQGYQGSASVIRYQGRPFVDAQELASITNGSLRFEKNRIILTVPGSDNSSSSNETGSSELSRPFMKAAIEAMASIREWGGTLLAIVPNGYPVTKTAAGYSITAYQARAADTVALASTVAITDSDRSGLELLRNEFNNVQAWSDAFVRSRTAMSAVNLTTSEDPLRTDQDAQKLVHCGQFLAQMFAGGTFEDDAACH